MGKIVLFLPDDEMIGQAMQLLQNQEYVIDMIKRVETKLVVEEAKAAVTDGAEVIIARGNQAMYIKQSLTVPVVDIRATGQELGLLLVEAKKLTGKEYPEISVIANKNMLPNTARLGEIYGADVRVYTVYSNIDIKLLVRKIAQRKPDVIIGGSDVIAAAEEFRIPTVYFTLTQDALREAFRVAEKMKYAIEIEKKSNAQIKALVDNSFTGILKTDRAGRVVSANELMKNILQKKEKDLTGRHICRLFPQLEEREVCQVLENGGPVRSAYMVLREHAVNLIITPVAVENDIEGLILFCYPLKKLKKTDIDRKKNFLKGYDSFDDLFHASWKMQHCVHLARSYVQSSSPIFIWGEPGTEKRELAEIIYHSSERKYGPYIFVDCAAWDGRSQEELIFGSHDGKTEGAVKQAENGVLVLQNIDCLTRKNQARMLEIMNYRLLRDKEGSRDVRLIATGTRVLEAVEAGVFCPELFYLISGLSLEIPPLRERPEDLDHALDYYFEYYKKKYSRFFTLTKRARKYILSRPWRGNLLELERFCERIILGSDTRLVSEEFVRSIYGETAQKERTQPGRDERTEKEQILELLEKYHGDRQKIADELGISKVTLWRRMKQYDIEQ